MSVLRPVVIDSDNLSLAWGQALLHAYDNPRPDLAPAVISITQFDTEVPVEDDSIRQAVDAELERLDKVAIRASALTIFPFEAWRRRGRPDCRSFCKLCVERLLPRLKGLDRRNRTGTYFERMMAFTGTKREQTRTVNQLEFVIELLRNRTRWPRQSALQIACFDPAKDHTGQPVRGFPCLQQVSISHDTNHRIALNAYYPTQYIFDRGYGNYLGLCHLGAFIAHETNLQFTRLNCFIGRPELGSVPKSAIRDLVGTVRHRLNEPQHLGG